MTLLRPIEPLPDGTITTSSPTTLPAAVAGLLYVAVVLMIVTSIGVAVGSTVGAVAGALAAAIDATTRRAVPPALVAGLVVLVTAGAAQAVLLVGIPRWVGPWADDRAIAALTALPFAIAGIGLWVAPVRRRPAQPSTSPLLDTNPHDISLP